MQTGINNPYTHLKVLLRYRTLLAQSYVEVTLTIVWNIRNFLTLFLSFVIDC